MKKIKTILSLVLALVMVMSVVSLVACNDKADDDDSTKRLELLVWAPSNAQTFYKQWAEKWAETYTDGNGNKYKIKMGIQEEDTAGTQLGNLGQDAADVFCFVDNQLIGLAKAGNLSQIGDPKKGALAKEIAERNVESSVNAAMYNDILYAYPMQADNSYFLYYNSSLLSEDDIKSWEGIFAKVEELNQPEAGKYSVQWDYGTAWYQSAFFLTFGGQISNEGTNFDSPEVGLKAMKAAHKLSSYTDIYMTGIDTAAQGINNGTVVAAVSGTWNYIDLTKNPDIKVAVLPTITIDGETKQMVPFTSSKLMGVNGQSKYQLAAHSLAEYLTSEEVQIAKITALAAGPSNLTALESDQAKALPTVAVLATQATYSVPQVNIPDGYWDAVTTCIDAMKADGASISDYYDAATKQYNETEMLKLLQQMVSSMGISG